MNLSKYLRNADSVGDWNGREHLAAENLNRIYHALDLALCCLVVGEEMRYHPDEYDAIMSQVWREWAGKPELLTLTDDDIRAYVERKNSVCPPPRVETAWPYI